MGRVQGVIHGQWTYGWAAGGGGVVVRTGRAADCFHFVKSDIPIVGVSIVVRDVDRGGHGNGPFLHGF